MTAARKLDPEQTGVRFDLYGPTGNMLVIHCTVLHRENVVECVAFDEGWSVLVNAVGFDCADPDIESYLCMLAKIEFWRKGGGR